MKYRAIIDEYCGMLHIHCPQSSRFHALAVDCAEMHGSISWEYVRGVWNVPSSAYSLVFDVLVEEFGEHAVKIPPQRAVNWSDAKFFGGKRSVIIEQKEGKDDKS